MSASQRVSRLFHRLVMGIFLLVVPTATAHAAEFSGSVDKIVDGDTLWVCDATACHKIRICGIDAPEKGEPATTKVRKLCGSLSKVKPFAVSRSAMGRPVTVAQSQQTTTGSLPSASRTVLI
jgi:endonuclease YncB( thermonuclease family)